MSVVRYLRNTDKNMTDPTQETNANPTNDTNGDVDDDSAEWKVQRDGFKLEGDASFRAGEFQSAVSQYTAALSLDPSNGTLLSNRSAAYLKLGERGRALQDAVACVQSNTMGIKGVSRHAAALQALGRYTAARDEWQSILTVDATHAAALAGQTKCQEQLLLLREKQQEQQQQQTQISTPEDEGETNDEEVDDLEDFFNDVEEAAVAVVQEKMLAAQPVATDAIQNHKKNLGTAQEQIQRLLEPPNVCYWHNLNPFHVLDLPHMADKEEISRRFKALSLLLHPDRNPSIHAEQAQLAYDQVLAAKAVLYDDDKLKHVRDLVEQGMIQGQADWAKATTTTVHNDGTESSLTLDDYQQKAVKRLFAEIEHTRRQVQQRERSFQQREQAHEDAAVNKEKNERTFDKQWKKEERVDKRIGNWRDFQTNKKKKSA